MDSTVPAPGSWEACKDALLAGFDAGLQQSRPRPVVSTQLHPAATDGGWPAVLVLGDDARIDRVAGHAESTHAVLVTDTDARVVATLRVTPEAACALVSALMPAATRSQTFLDAILEGIDLVPPTVPGQAGA